MKADLKRQEWSNFEPKTPCSSLIEQLTWYTKHFVNYRPVVVLCLPLADLHHFCLTKQFPKIPAPSSRSEHHLHFALIRLCMALLFIIPISSLHYPLSWHPSFIDNPLWTSGLESQFWYSLSTNIFLFQMNAVA